MSSMGYAAGIVPARAQTLFGRVMALVAPTVGFATLGVYLARHLGGADWFVAWLLALGCLLGHARLAIFGLYSPVDFNRPRQAGTDEAIPLAAGIFLDVLNIFLRFLRLTARQS
jgi:hypothetical protein